MSRRRLVLGDPAGIWAQWSPINQAWFIRFANTTQVLRIFTLKAAAADFLRDCRA